MAYHPSSTLVWVQGLSISGSNWKENFAWSCTRMGKRIINGEWWQDAKINYEGYWNDIASFDWQKVSQNDLFSLCCVLLCDLGSHPLRNLCLHWSHVFVFVTLKWQRLSVCVCDSTESCNRKALSPNLFLLIIVAVCAISPDVTVWAY